MIKSVQFWVLSAVGAACVLFVLGNMVLFTGNQKLQGEVSQRAQYIQQTSALQGLYQQMVRAVAELSVKDKDAKLTAILAQQGLHVTVHPAPQPAAAAATPPKPAARRQGAHRHE